MKIFLLKALLLLLFLVLLFLILRVLEGVAWYETGLVISQIVDPLSLSVRKLKVLLDGRGISYGGVVEKQELTSLLQASGDVMEGELLLLEREEEEEERSTSFSSGPHFYEEVEDKKDSIWLIQVIPRGNFPLLEKETWKTVIKKVSHFGIRAGTFDCSHDNRFCRKRGWTQPILILATPQGLNQKDSVVMATYPSSNLKASKVLNWVNSRLAKTVNTVDEGQLVKEWLKPSDGKPSTPPIKFILLSEEEDAEAPLFFSAISLKYSGRVKFRQAFIGDRTQKLLSENFKIETKSSRYLVGTPEGFILYGMDDGEYMNHRSMDVYLRTLYPQANDFFMLSFMIGNMLCVLEIAVSGDDVLAKRVCHFLWVWAKYNAILITLWLPLLALTQIPFLDPAFQFCHKILRLWSQTGLASQIRCMWIMHSYHSGLIVASFLFFCAVVGYCQSRLSRAESEAQEGTSSTEWLQSTMGDYYNMLVRPSPGYTPVILNNAHVESGVPWNPINPLGFPNLFLLADKSQDYVKDLPTWYYQREIKAEPSMKSFFRNGSCWNVCSPDNKDKRHQENCQLLREYFMERDKHLKEFKEAEKYTKRGKKHSCKKWLPRFVDDPRRGEPFLVTDDHKVSDSCKEGAVLNLPPENLGSTSLDVNQTFTKNVQTEFENSSCKENPPGNGQGRVPISDEKSKEYVDMKPICDCDLLDLQANMVDRGLGDVATINPWPEGMMKSSECSICLEPYMQGVELCGLPCGHAFHQRCVTLWLTSNRNHCCPNCRWPAFKTKGSKLSKHKD
ncbi:E3 ubiquitin-protein ligase RNF103-like [Asterias rubens]|uniref:E3 ubiquitin-protein ligase RNF103-like n=1 Tax=Asterias rubens TaxID=7604 RepID=UPI0014552A53|nr:E3 ubiquitin-protein ligase RNF103-like [Asterias rubens]